MRHRHPHAPFRFLLVCNVGLFLLAHHVRRSIDAARSDQAAVLGIMGRGGIQIIRVVIDVAGRDGRGFHERGSGRRRNRRGLRRGF